MFKQERYEQKNFFWSFAKDVLIAKYFKTNVFFYKFWSGYPRNKRGCKSSSSDATESRRDAKESPAKS